MTVSPTRPQDGNPLSVDQASGPNNHDGLQAASLPPTLFRLPNLNRASLEAPSFESEESPNADQNPRTTQNFDSSLDSAATPNGDCHGGSQHDREACDRDLVDYPSRGGLPIPCGNDGISSSSKPVTFESRSGACSLSEMQTERLPTAGDPPTGNQNAASSNMASSNMASSNMASSNMASSDDAGSTKPRNPIPPNPSGLEPGTPAGRSWMESLGSHGVVIVLLLVVVAAALMTGPRDQEDASNSLATQSDLLDFDRWNTELPLPHDGIEPTDQLADQHGLSGVLVQASEFPNQSPTISNQSTEISGAMGFQPKREPLAPSYSVSSDPYSNSNRPIDNVAGAAPNQQPVVLQGNTPDTSLPMSMATLNAPSEVSGQAGQPINATDAARQRLNTSVIEPRGGVAAMAVADAADQSQDRVSNVGNQVSASKSSLPSLEELVADGDVDRATTSANVSAPEPAHRTTMTPAGIPDWSKYLPPLDQAGEIEDRSTASYTEVLQP